MLFQESQIKEHILKIKNIYFENILNRTKLFEIRLNDRNFKQGNKIILLEVNDLNGYTGRKIKADIGFITNFEQKENFVVFSLLNIKEF